VGHPVTQGLEPGVTVPESRCGMFQQPELRNSLLLTSSDDRVKREWPALSSAVGRHPRLSEPSGHIEVAGFDMSRRC
jgi:hypothetical protein